MPCLTGSLNKHYVIRMLLYKTQYETSSYVYVSIPILIHYKMCHKAAIEKTVYYLLYLRWYVHFNHPKLFFNGEGSI